MSRKGPEAATQKLILDWLAAERIWHERRNTGASMFSNPGSEKVRLMRFSRPGTADIMATPSLMCMDGDHRPHVLWIEVKAPKGKQSDAQKEFQAEVEAAGHVYVLAYSLEDVIGAIRET